MTIYRIYVFLILLFYTSSTNITICSTVATVRLALLPAKRGQCPTDYGKWTMGTQCGHWTVDGGHLTSHRRSRQPKVESNFAWAANLHASVSSAGHVFHSSSCLVCECVCVCWGIYFYVKSVASFYYFL